MHGPGGIAHLCASLTFTFACFCAFCVYFVHETMKNIQREQQILGMLSTAEVVPVSDMAVRFDVSEATIRRDLSSMEERGLLHRVHGGATLAGISRNEPMFRDKEGRNTAAKKLIAQAALTHIQDGDTIYLDGGSTVLQLAKLLDRRHNLVIVSNSIMAAAALMDTEHRLILVGGEFRKLSRTLVGPLTSPIIRSLHVDKAFMGTIGFTLEQGMTTTDPNEAHTKEQIMERASQVILLADSSKLGVSSFARSGAPQDLDMLITDHAEPDLLHGLERLGLQVLMAHDSTTLTHTTN